ncbi:MAG: hypothetical protein WC470_01375 [Candidatus Paceibacterota bacterium]
MQTAIILTIIRKLLFGLSVGLGFFAIILFSKPLLERAILKTKFDDDAYYWGEIIIAVILAILAMIIV